MPTSSYFDQIAPFPLEEPIADIPIISLDRLETGDSDEATNLFRASRQHGFFLLDLQDSPRDTLLLEDAAMMFDLTAETLDVDREILDRFAYRPPEDLLGFKPAGNHKTNDGVDATELYSIGQDDLLGVEPRQNPQPIENRRVEWRRFIQRAYNAVTVILNVLDGQLGLPKGTLADLSSQSKDSATSLRLLRTRPQKPNPLDRKKITLAAHTDIGLISMLFHVASGLQILPADQQNLYENWRFIQPQPGCAFINLGDTLVEWTGGLVRSCLHRVVTAPGLQYRTTRISIAYLVRPARQETMRRLCSSNDMIPQAEGEEDRRPVEEWAAERADQIIKGILRPGTNGGVVIVSS